MNAESPRPPHRAIALAACLLVLVAGGLAVFFAREARQDILREAEVRAAGQAMLMAERLQGLLNLADLMLLVAEEDRPEPASADARPAGRLLGLFFPSSQATLFVTRRGATSRLGGEAALPDPTLPAVSQELERLHSRFDLRAVRTASGVLLLVNRLATVPAGETSGEPVLLTAALDAKAVFRELRRLDVEETDGLLVLDHRGAVLLNSADDRPEAAALTGTLPAAWLARPGFQATALDAAVAVSYQLAHFPLKIVIVRDLTSLLAAWRQDALRRALLLGSAALVLLLALRHAWRSDSRQRRSEAAARVSEAKYRSLFDNAADAMFLFDRDQGRYLDANASAQARLGRSLAEILTHGPGDFDAEDGRLKRPERLAALERTGRVIFETEHVAHDGRRLPVEVNIAGFEVDGRRYAISVVRDLTERNRLQADLRQTHEKLRAVFDAIPGLIHVVDREFRLIDQSEKGAGPDAEDRDQWFGQPCHRVHRRLDAVCPDCVVTEVFRTGRPCSKVVSLLERPDARFPAKIVAAPLFDEHGEIWAAVKLIMDVSDLAAAQEALRLSEGRYKALLEDQVELVARCDAAERVALCNSAFGQAAGQAPTDLVGRSLADVLAGEDGLPVRRTLAGLTPGQALGRVTARLPAGERPRWIDWSCRAFFGPGESLEGYQLVGHDVTERLEHQRRQEDVERLIRHDIRSPIASALHVPRLLREYGPLTKEQAFVLNLFKTSASRAVRLLDLSLDLHRLESGQLVLPKRVFDLLPILDAIRQELAQLALTRQSRLVVVPASAAGQSPTRFRLQGDPGLTHALLENLLRNALEATPPDHPVEIRLGQDGEDALIAVHNRGAAPRELRARMFEKYATQGKAKGTGLGIYSARLMARAQGGEVTCEIDDEADATTFLARLPGCPLAS